MGTHIVRDARARRTRGVGEQDCAGHALVGELLPENRTTDARDGSQRTLVVRDGRCQRLVGRVHIGLQLAEQVGAHRVGAAGCNAFRDLLVAFDIQRRVDHKRVEQAVRPGEAIAVPERNLRVTVDLRRREADPVVVWSGGSPSIRILNFQVAWKGQVTWSPKTVVST
jgi:hypothetical protein